MPVRQEWVHMGKMHRWIGTAGRSIGELCMIFADIMITTILAPMNEECGAKEDGVRRSIMGGTVGGGKPVGCGISMSVRYIHTL
ncbi:MAG: hypothetical protein HQK96_08560 [Nitrospirae bacterium]|nr:hypothetical protein [Nitrospirota bacterium]